MNKVATATTVEETKAVLEAKLNYVAKRNGIILFRKPKWFSF
jgi:hypothetical protein